MAKKDRIVYVAPRYVFGSEAEQAQAPVEVTKPPKAAGKTRLVRIYIDPIAVCATVILIAMVIAGGIGIVRMNRSWKERQQLQTQLDELTIKNAALSHEYHTSYDLEEIRNEAEHFQFVPSSDVEHIRLYVRVPEPVQPRTWLDDMKWFLSGLFANARHGEA